VKRAESLEVAAAGRLQGDVFGDDVDHGDTLAQQRDVLLADMAGHDIHPAPSGMAVVHWWVC
jgi:hypothetical protein